MTIGTIKLTRMYGLGAETGIVCVCGWRIVSGPAPFSCAGKKNKKLAVWRYEYSKQLGLRYVRGHGYSRCLTLAPREAVALREREKE